MTAIVCGLQHEALAAIVVTEILREPSMNDHELRQVLNDELHGRTGMRIYAPARITHMAFTITEKDPSPAAHVMELAIRLNQTPPAQYALHHHVKLQGGYLRFERHGEFYRISIIAEKKLAAKAEAIDLVPKDWLEGLPGKRLVAVHTRLITKTEKLPELDEFFGHEDIAASLVSQGSALVATDFRIGEDGYSRWLVQDRGLAPARLGRVIRRIHEVETYRMMALLALPTARAAQKELRPLEQDLHDVILRMSEVNGDNDAAMLARLTAVARHVEELSNRTSYRFAAARAYAALVDKRISELGEARVSNFQRVGVYLDRRFGPAVATCNATAARIEALAARSERANNLLRTRVDIALEAQNQDLLRSMDRRARQQLHLQEAVEGLSVAAISYYMISIADKLQDGLGHYWEWANAKWISILLIAVCIGAVWFAVRRFRARGREL